MNLLEKSETLLSVCGECLERHAQMRAEDREPDFYNEVKPYADHYHALLKEWEQEVREWIQKKKPRYVHPNQIDSLVDSMSQFIVQSFYKGTGKKRFVLSINSASYTLKTILDALEHGGAANEEV